MNESVLGYWFAKDDTLPHGDGRKVVIGETITVKGPPVLCEHGLHASKRVRDALRYAPGPILYRVRLSGTIVHGDDKMVATERTALWRLDATRALHLFACDVAEAALRAERKRGREPDKRSWEAIRVKRLWIQGTATDQERSAAAAAAYAAAYAAAAYAAAATAAAYAAAATAAAYAAAAADAAAANATAAAYAYAAYAAAANRMLMKRIREARKP